MKNTNTLNEFAQCARFNFFPLFFLFCYPRDENFFAFLTTEDIDGDEQIRFSFYYYFMDQKKTSEGRKKKSAMFLHYLFFAFFSCARFSVTMGGQEEFLLVGNVFLCF